MMSNPKVLIVDDDPAWLEELVPLLNNANYDVETAHSFDLARDKLLTTGYAVIIIDLELGGSEVPQAFEGLGLLSGLQFLEEVAQRQSKAIVLSAYGTTENIRQAFKRGAYDFIDKQKIEENEFLENVREAVEQWESGRAVATQRELTPEEEKEYKRVTLQFRRGQPVQFDVPEDAVNPWAEESQVSSNRCF